MRALMAYAVALAGCSLSFGEGYSGGAPSEDAGDASVEAAAGSLEAGSDVDAEVDAGAVANLLPNAGFESASDCAPWSSSSSTSTLSSVAHSGTSSCRVCSNSASSYFSINAPIGLADVVPGQVYRVEAWVRATGDAPPPTTVNLYQRIYRDTGGATLHSGQMTSLDTTWRQIFFEQEMEVSGKMNVYLDALPSTGPECFLLDDLVLVRVR